MGHCSRRHFLKTGVALAQFAGAASIPMKGATQTATDWVTLGNTDVKVTRLALEPEHIVGKYSATWASRSSRAWCATRMIVAFGSLKLRNHTARCTRCSV